MRSQVLSTARPVAVALVALLVGPPAFARTVRCESRGQALVPLADPLAKSREAFAVRKGDPDLVFFLDACIRHFQDTGWLTEKRKYWFESFAWEDQL